MFTIKENSIRPSSLIANFGPPPTAAATQQTVNANPSQASNKLAAGLRSGKFGTMQGESVFPASVIEYLVENPEAEIYVGFTFETDEPKKVRGAARMPSKMPSDAAMYGLATMPETLQNEFRAKAGKMVNLPTSQKLADDAEVNDYKTGSKVWYTCRVIVTESGQKIPFFSYDSKIS